MLGHASAAMTLDTYSDLFPDDLESVSDAFDDAVGRLDRGGSRGSVSTGVSTIMQEGTTRAG